MAGHTKATQLRTFIILRLFIATFLLFLAQVVFRQDTLIFYYIIAMVCVLSLIYLVWLIYEKNFTALSWTQMVIDTFLETLLIQFTGVVDSLFAPIYVLSVISAGIVIAPQASFAIAGLSSVLFVGLVVANQFHLIPDFLSGNLSFQVERDPLYLFYATYVRVTIFFVVAILTNYLTGTIRALEERVRLQERLAFLGDITSKIAHEIRNPLAAVSSSVEVLSGELAETLTPRNKRLMSAVVDESERLKRIFNKILIYARNDELHLKNVNIAEVLERVLLLFERSKDFDSKKYRIYRNYESRKTNVMADEELITDMLTNVIRNAFESMPSGGELKVELLEKQNEADIVISDSGVGMSDETLKTLFTPFKTTKKTGTGLGLAQAHKIAIMHKGSIRVKSKQGIGTRIQINLPVKP